MFAFHHVENPHQLILRRRRKIFGFRAFECDDRAGVFHQGRRKRIHFIERYAGTYFYIIRIRSQFRRRVLYSGVADILTDKISVFGFVAFFPLRFHSAEKRFLARSSSPDVNPVFSARYTC